jgi:hypothetical protein
MSFTSADWDQLMESLQEEECLLADGFDMALVGISCGIEPRAVYDINKMKRILQDRDGMTEEEAVEFLDFNVICAYVGPKTPIIIDLDFMRACAFMQDPSTHSSDG